MSQGKLSGQAGASGSADTPLDTNEQSSVSILLQELKVGEQLRFESELRGELRERAGWYGRRLDPRRRRPAPAPDLRQQCVEGVYAVVALLHPDECVARTVRGTHDGGTKATPTAVRAAGRDWPSAIMTDPEVVGPSAHRHAGQRGSGNSQYGYKEREARDERERRRRTPGPQAGGNRRDPQTGNRPDRRQEGNTFQQLGFQL